MLFIKENKSVKNNEKNIEKEEFINSLMFINASCDYNNNSSMIQYLCCNKVKYQFFNYSLKRNNLSITIKTIINGLNYVKYYIDDLFNIFRI